MFTRNRSGRRHAADRPLCLFWVMIIHFLVLCFPSHGQEPRAPRRAPAWAVEGNLFKNGDFSKPLSEGWTMETYRGYTIFGDLVSKDVEGVNWARIDTKDRVLTVHHLGTSGIVVRQKVEVHSHELLFGVNVKLWVKGKASTNSTARVVLAYMDRKGRILGRNIVLLSSGLSEVLDTANSEHDAMNAIESTEGQVDTDPIKTFEKKLVVENLKMKRIKQKIAAVKSWHPSYLSDSTVPVEHREMHIAEYDNVLKVILWVCGYEKWGSDISATVNGYKHGTDVELGYQLRDLFDISAIPNLDNFDKLIVIPDEGTRFSFVSSYIWNQLKKAFVDAKLGSTGEAIFDSLLVERQSEFGSGFLQYFVEQEKTAEDSLEAVQAARHLSEQLKNLVAMRAVEDSLRIYLRKHYDEPGPTLRYLDTWISEGETDWMEYNIDLESEFERHLTAVDPALVRYVGVYFYCASWLGQDETEQGHAQIKVSRVVLQYKPEVLGY